MINQETYITDKALAECFGVSRATIWRWTASNNFPSPKKLSAGCTRWLVSEVEDWESNRRKIRSGLEASA